MSELSVCIGSSCHLNGSYNIINIFQQLIEEYSLHDKINFKATFCMKECHNPGVTVTFNGVTYNISSETAKEFFTATVMPKIS